MNKKQYTHKHPQLNLRTQNDLLRFLNAAGEVKAGNQILRKKLTSADLDHVTTNSALEWNDHESSDAVKGKYVRALVPGTKLNLANRRLNAALKRTLDKKAPDFFYGSVGGYGPIKKGHVRAAARLCNGKNTTIISLDVTKFFETISYDRVIRFFIKAGCTHNVATELANLTCVPRGPKNNPEAGHSLARGFPTSPRLALWSTYEIFVKLNRVLQKKYKYLSPKIVVFVDDIGISIKNATDEDLTKIKKTAFEIIEGDKNGIALHVHRSAPKLQIKHISDTAEHLGLVIGKSSVAPGIKTRQKISHAKKLLASGTLSADDRKTICSSKRGLMNYKRSIIPGAANVTSRATVKQNISDNRDDATLL